jgi:outer membrane protein TolC
VRRLVSIPIALLLLGTAQVVAAHAVAAQGVAPQSAPADTLTLATLHALAERHDPRATQADLLERQSELRTETLRRERLPALSALALGQYLSDVTSVPGAPFPAPLQQQYDAYLSARHTIFDPSRGRRDALEQAQLAESQAGLRGTLWQQRLAVNEAYFAVLLRQAQGETLNAAITELQQRRSLARTRVEAGAALASEVALLDAELARREQLLREVAAEAEASRAVLGELTGLDIADDAVLAVPDAPERSLPAVDRSRPEFTQFAAGRAALDAQRAVLGAQRLPRVALVGRAGYGRPGLNQLGREFDSYYVAGLQVEWSPWDWGAARRAREVQSLQAQVVESHEAAFASALERAAVRDRARMAALADALEADERIVALRESILAEAQLRHDEGDITTADYVARLTEALTARLDRETRRVQLAEVRARYLTTIGREVR